MTEEDEREFNAGVGSAVVFNGATLRTTFAVRNVVLTSNAEGPHPDLRIVLQMSEPCPFVEASSFAGQRGRRVLFPMDLSHFLNGLLFKSAIQPGLARLLMSIFDFQAMSGLLPKNIDVKRN